MEKIGYPTEVDTSSKISGKKSRLQTHHSKPHYAQILKYR